MSAPSPDGRRVIIAGGGTGGHLYPGLALADTLAARGYAVDFVGTAGGIEARVVPESGYPLHLLPGRQMRGGGPARAVMALGTAVSATLRGLRLLRDLRPVFVAGVGGYASAALVMAARLRRIPTVLLEQNVIPGAANRTLARVAQRVCVGFAESIAYFPGGRAVHTGNPVRADLLQRAVRTPGSERGRLGLLVFGGSAGARQVNRATVEAMRILGATAWSLDVVHQTGTADVDEVRAGYAALALPVRVEPFIADMGTAYAAADVVVARAGAMSCAEITAIGLPAILVPYPHAADDHQRANAEVLVRAGAAEMILDRDLDGERLATALGALVRDSERRTRMAAAARAYGIPDAAERVADECERISDPRREKTTAV